jgi:predicted oxidoreductase
LRGQTLAELAETAGIEAGGLEATVEVFNRDARLGKDSAFGKGTTSYNRRMGDDLHKPNPCVAPLEQAPFYAVKLVISDRGTYVGLSTDIQSRVLDPGGRPIPGLYAAGNDMASLLGGTDAGGSMLAQAITSGFVAGRHLGRLD